MSLTLTDADREAIAEARRKWLRQWGDELIPLEERYYLAGMRAGIERAAQLVGRGEYIHESSPAFKFAAAIRALAK